MANDHFPTPFDPKQNQGRLENTQKSKTTRFLKHNHYDVVGMRYLLEQIINDDPKLLRKAIYKLTDNKTNPNDKKKS